MTRQATRATTRTTQQITRRTTWRTVLHALMLVALVAGAVPGVVMLAGNLVMIVNSARGGLPVPDPSVAQVVLGVLMVLLWSGVILAGLSALYRQCHRSVDLAAWVTHTGHAPTARLAMAIHAATHTAVPGIGPDRRVIQVDEEPAYAFTYGIWHPAS